MYLYEQKVGCNGVRNASMKEDKCGVCGGDGKSCKTVEGVFKKQFKYSAGSCHMHLQIPMVKCQNDLLKINLRSFSF